MDAMTVLVAVLVAVLAVLGVKLVRSEREAQRTRQAMAQATQGLDTARRDLVAARDVLRSVKAGRQ